MEHSVRVLYTISDDEDTYFVDLPRSDDTCKSIQSAQARPYVLTCKSAVSSEHLLKAIQEQNDDVSSRCKMFMLEPTLNAWGIVPQRIDVDAGATIRVRIKQPSKRRRASVDSVPDSESELNTATGATTSKEDLGRNKKRRSGPVSVPVVLERARAWKLIRLQSPRKSQAAAARALHEQYGDEWPRREPMYKRASALEEVLSFLGRTLGVEELDPRNPDSLCSKTDCWFDDHFVSNVLNKFASKIGYRLKNDTTTYRLRFQRVADLEEFASSLMKDASVQWIPPHASAASSSSSSSDVDADK